MFLIGEEINRYLPVIPALEKTTGATIFKPVSDTINKP